MKFVQVLVWFSTSGKAPGAFDFKRKYGLHSAMLLMDHPNNSLDQYLWNKDNWMEAPKEGNETTSIGKDRLEKLLRLNKPFHHHVAIKRTYRTEETDDLLESIIPMEAIYGEYIDGETFEGRPRRRGSVLGREGERDQAWELQLFNDNRDDNEIVDNAVRVDAYVNFVNEEEEADGETHGSSAGHVDLRMDDQEPTWTDMAFTDPRVSPLQLNIEEQKRKSFREYHQYRLGRFDDVQPVCLILPVQGEGIGTAGLYYEKMKLWFCIIKDTPLVKYNFLKANCSMGVYKCLQTGLADGCGKKVDIGKGHGVENFSTDISPRQVVDYAGRLKKHRFLSGPNPNLYDPAVLRLAKVDVYRANVYSARVGDHASALARRRYELREIESMLKIVDSIRGQNTLLEGLNGIFGTDLGAISLLKELTEGHDNRSSLRSLTAPSISRNLGEKQNSLQASIRAATAEHHAAIRRHLTVPKIHDLLARTYKLVSILAAKVDSMGESQEDYGTCLDVLHNLRSFQDFLNKSWLVLEDLENGTNTSPDPAWIQISGLVASSEYSGVVLANDQKLKRVLPSQLGLIKEFVNEFRTILKAVTKTSHIDAFQNALNSATRINGDQVAKVYAIAKALTRAKNLAGKYIYDDPQTARFVALSSLFLSIKLFTEEHAWLLGLMCMVDSNQSTEKSSFESVSINYWESLLKKFKTSRL